MEILFLKKIEIIIHRTERKPDNEEDSSDNLFMNENILWDKNATSNNIANIANLFVISFT
jgi:hypothetical protein